MVLAVQAFCETVPGFAWLARLSAEQIRAAVSDERLADALRNGQAQKLEYVTELCWKAIKAHLKAREGIDEVSPKKIVKAAYLAGLLNEEDYALLLQAIEDRNHLSHVYDTADFNEVLARLPGYAQLFERLAQRLTADALSG